MTKKNTDTLNGLRISLCQMKVMPGRPDVNASCIIEEIEAAQERGADIIVFPEMCTTGYIIGDVFEDDFFIEDVLFWNRKISEAARNITAIFGSVTAEPKKNGEDGRQRKHNSAIVAQNGKVITEISKTLQPNYRFFNDDKHFYSSRKTAQELAVPDILKPVKIETRMGKISLGVILCEDMWHKDYPFNPAKILKKRGAQLLINISASPWTWQKNRKRHQVIKELINECHVPFIYVNNTGCQNTGKNVIVFDGSSAVYNSRGGTILDIFPYVEGPHDFVFRPSHSTVGPDYKSLRERTQNDSEDLYDAMACATKSMVPASAKVIVGLSGGIDSAVVCAHLADVLGKDRVVAVNMPMPFNSQKTRDFAAAVAENLGVNYEIAPIGEIVEAICKATGVEPDTLAYENVQARVRREILSAKAQKVSGLFVCCSNKTEIAFGYGTLYGDIAGFYAPLGDSVKREVKQIADYLNKVRFKREVIPENCINQVPTAELKAGQKDPFDYGDANKRGYHDEMIRAFTEFRKNPEWFFELYLKGRLEKELKLEPGTLKRLFPTAKDFVNDLKSWWTKFQQSYFKRVQCPPIPVFSKRAFGRDLEESLMSAHFTQRCKYLESYLLSKDEKKKIAIFGASFNPPGLHHKLIVEKLAETFDLVLVVPCGIRTDKPSTAIASTSQRKEMTALTFRDIAKVECDFYDLDKNTFTPTCELEERYRQLFKDAELWFAAGSDLTAGGNAGNSEIQRVWKKGKEVWQSLNFAIISQPAMPVEPADLPPKSTVIEIKIIIGRSTVIREKMARGESIESLVTPEVARYIKENGIYKGSS